MNDEDYGKWNMSKQKISRTKSTKRPRIKEIWWCNIGVNIGSEFYGKGEDYSRPVLIINRESDSVCLGIPLSSKLHNSKYSTVVSSNTGNHTAHLYQTRVFDNRRFTKKLGKLPDIEYVKIQEKFNKLFII